jgi:tol-pal system protein YbgF
MAGLSHRTIGLSFLALLFCASVAAAQENERGFLEQLFGNSNRAPESAPADTPDRGGPNAGRLAQSSELAVRLDRLESQIRQLTGAIEQLQYRNQQLEGQLRRMQQDAEYRTPEGSGRGAPLTRAPMSAQPMQPQATQPQATQPQATQPQATQPYSPSAPPAGSRRGDAFDPSVNPNAPGAPRPLGTTAPSAPLAQSTDPEEAIGAPGGRSVGAPLDLSTLTGLAGNPDAPPPASRNPGGTAGGAQVATLPPSDSPKDTYDLAYGYILRREYAMAEDTFRVFLRRFPNDRLSSDAQYWLGESLFQRQRYRDAAEMFLNISTKFETSAKAPDSLLRLGQSLAGLGERDAACASFAEVGRKYPRASVSVKQGVEREQKRVRC